MTLIKCPNCGRTVLSVASTCPQCSAALTRDRPPHTWAGTLTECRKCGHPVTTEARVCPHCSIPRPGRRGPSPVALAAFTLTLLATVGLAVVVPKLGDNSSALPSARPIRAAPPPVKRVSLPAPDTPRSTPVDSVPGVARPPDTVVVSAAPPVPAPTPAAAPAQADTQQGPPAITPQTRWATNLWVNVREGPANEAPIVGVLRPGQRVEAGAPTWDGWQLVYVDGKRMGYVARSLLGSRPPNQ